MTNEVKIARIRVREEVRDAEDIIQAHNVDARCFQTDALTGDPATVVLIAMAALEVIREVRVLLGVFLSRGRSVEIAVGETKISVANPSDLDKVTKFLEQQVPHGDRVGSVDPDQLPMTPSGG